MKNLIRHIVAATVMVLASSVANSMVLYKFSFTNLQNWEHTATLPDFGFTLTEADNITTGAFTPITPLSSTALAALGYEVAYAGIVPNTQGWWGFDDINQGASILDHTFNFDTASFLFDSSLGTVTGNANNRAFNGRGTLTVTTVPEASAPALLGLGLACLVFIRRKAIPSGHDNP